MDRIVTYDRLSEGLAQVASEIGIPRINLPHELKAPRADRPAMIYTPDLARIVEDRYSKEIERFGFKAPALTDSGR